MILLLDSAATGDASILWICSSSLFVALLIFSFAFSWNSSVLFREFALPALPPSRALSNTPPPPLLAFFSRRVWLNQCHCCYHRCARDVPDPDALAPAASPHGRAGSYNLATPPEKDPLIAIRVSLNHRRCCVPQRTLQIGNPRDQRQRRQIKRQIDPVDKEQAEERWRQKR